MLDRRFASSVEDGDKMKPGAPRHGLHACPGGERNDHQ